METRAARWALGLTMAAGLGLGLGACFNPPSDATATGPDLGCSPGFLGCSCTDAGTCDAGLQCEAGQCVSDDGVTGTMGTSAGSSGSGSVDPSADGSSTAAETTAAETTAGLDGTTSIGTTGYGTISDGTTSDGTTGGESTGPGSSSGMPEPVMETVDFPTAADPRVIASGTNPWNAGDYFEGMRNTMVPSVGQLDVHLEIPANSLSACGFQEAAVSLNGQALGTFVVAQGDTAIDQSFMVVPPVVGPAYTIRYQTTATVAGGCGSAAYGEVGSTVTLYE